MKKNILILASLLLALSSCSDRDRLKSMHDNTAEMKETTEKMKETTENVHSQNRSERSEDARRRSFKAIDEQKTLNSKMAEAGIYFKGFEYQLWTNGETKIDSAEFRKELQESATFEFFLKLHDYLIDVDLEDMSISEQKNEELNLYALAIALHSIHDDQAKRVHKDGIERITMLSMIKSALEKEKRIQDGENIELEDFEKNIISYQEIATALIKMRFNAFMALSLNKVSDIDLKEANKLKKLKRMRKKWNSPILKKNLAIQEDAITYLSIAAEEREFLNSIGEKDFTDRKIGKVLSNMKIKLDRNQPTSSTNAGMILSLRDQVVLELTEEERKKEIEKNAPINGSNDGFGKRIKSIFSKVKGVFKKDKKEEAEIKEDQEK